MFLKQLEYFCAVAKYGNFTKAAEACFVSQSAISQQIKALETEFGCKLIDRKGRSFTLTNAGEHLAHRGRELLNEAESLRYEIEDIAYERPSKLSIGYLNRYDGLEIAGAVGAFVRRHPTVEVTATPDSHDALKDAVEKHELDVTFSDKRRSFSPDYNNHYLTTCYDFVEVSLVNPLSNEDTLTVKQLENQTCIVLATPEQEKTEYDYYRNVMSFPCDFVTAASMEQARLLVAANRGILPVESRNSEPLQCNVTKRIPLIGPDPFTLSDTQLKHDYYAYWPKDASNIYIEEFVGILDDLFATPAQTSA